MDKSKNIRLAGVVLPRKQADLAERSDELEISIEAAITSDPKPRSRIIRAPTSNVQAKASRRTRYRPTDEIQSWPHRDPIDRISTRGGLAPGAASQRLVTGRLGHYTPTRRHKPKEDSTCQPVH